MSNQTENPTEQPASGALPIDLDKLSNDQLIELGKQALLKAQDRADIQHPEQAVERQTFNETVDWIEGLDTDQILALDLMIHNAQDWQDEGLPEDEIKRRLGELGEAIKNPPVDLDKMTPAQFSALHWAVIGKMLDISNEKKQVEEERIVELKAELAELTGKDIDKTLNESEQDADLLDDINYDATASDPNYDPHPRFKKFGSMKIEPCEKWHLKEAAVVVAALIYNEIIPVIPAAPLDGSDMADDIAEAIMIVSRGMWHVRHNHNMSTFGYDGPGYVTDVDAESEVE